MWQLHSILYEVSKYNLTHNDIGYKYRHVSYFEMHIYIDTHGFIKNVKLFPFIDPDDPTELHTGHMVHLFSAPGMYIIN